MDGKLDPEFVRLYNDNVANIPNKPIDLAVLRKNYSTIYSYGTAPAPAVGSIENTTFKSFDGEEVGLRIYRPKASTSASTSGAGATASGPSSTASGPNCTASGPNSTASGANSSASTAGAGASVHIDFHGGGWGLGDLDTESHILQHYVDLASVVVVDVDYRLVPDYPYPTGLLDCFEAVKYVHANGAKLGVDSTSISVGGVSAGANIALAVSHLARDAGISLKLCVAGTPQVDDIEPYGSAQDSPYASCQECEFAPTLNWARLKWFDKLKWDSLSPDPTTKAQQLKDIGWFKSIITAPDFNNLPKTVIFTAGCDPMRDEGEAYAAKMVQNGNEVVFKRYPGVPHPFMHMDADLWQASDFIKRTAYEIALAHGTVKSFTD